MIDKAAGFAHSFLMNSERPALKHLFISPQHNFVGHHGGEPGESVMEDLDGIVCEAGSGIVGDRYFDHKPDYKGQITFFAWETFLEMRQVFPQKNLEPWVFRRNIITSGLDLNELIGSEFEVQGVRFAGTEEARPCDWMNRVIGDGARTALEGRGGLRARILSTGPLRKGPADLHVFVCG